VKTRSLTIQIPKPNEEGLCLTSCKLLKKVITTKCWFYSCIYGQTIDSYCSPGPGCPWHDGGKDE
jgi:hypothetical protein